MLLARNLREALKLIMESHGWPQSRLARELGVSQPWVSDIVRGAHDCPFGKAVSLLAKVGWEVRITPKVDGGEAEDDPVKRREFLAGAASVGFVPSPKTTPFHDPFYVNQLAQRITQAHYQTGGSSMTATLLHQARKINSASVSGGRELQSAASEFMRRGSYILRQAGRSDISTRFANSAVRHASQATDPDKQAEAYFALIHATTFNGHDGSLSTAGKGGSGAVVLARRGLEVPGVGDLPRADLNVCLACGLANVPGNERQARIALKKALSIDTGPAVDRAVIIGHAGNALRDMGERREALKLLEDAIRQCAPHSHFNHAQYLCDQIMITLAMREPERAASLMNDLSYVVPFVDSARVDRQVEHVLRSAKPWATVAEVRDARTRLQSVSVTNEDL